jgi:hypothetical protein
METGKNNDGDETPENPGEQININPVKVRETVGRLPIYRGSAKCELLWKNPLEEKGCLVLSLDSGN